MFVTIVTSVTVAVIVCLLFPRRRRITHAHVRTVDDAAALIAGLPIDELRELDRRLHTWIDRAEL